MQLKSQKGAGYHLDMLVVGLMMGVCSLFGLPWCVAATVLCLGHVDRWRVIIRVWMSFYFKSSSDFQLEERQRVQRTWGAASVPWSQRAGRGPVWFTEIRSRISFVEDHFALRRSRTSFHKILSYTENHWHLCLPSGWTLHSTSSDSQVRKTSHLFKRSSRDHSMILSWSHYDLNLIKLLSQADPHASSLRRVDVHGGEHVARDAVHRPPRPHVHAHQVHIILIR